MSGVVGVRGFLLKTTAPPAAPFAWNPADKDATVTLSAGNLTADAPPSPASVRGDQGKSSGRWFYEVTVNGGTYCIIGIGDSAAPLTSYPGSDSHGVGYFGLNGAKFGGTGAGTSGASYVAGDKISVDFDAGAGTVNFYKNGTLQGTASTVSAATYYPMFGSGGAGANCNVTINTTPTFPVSGATQW